MASAARHCGFLFRGQTHGVEAGIVKNAASADNKNAPLESMIFCPNVDGIEVSFPSGESRPGSNMDTFVLCQKGKACQAISVLAADETTEISIRCFIGSHARAVPRGMDQTFGQCRH